MLPVSLCDNFIDAEYRSIQSLRMYLSTHDLRRNTSTRVARVVASSAVVESLKLRRQRSQHSSIVMENVIV